MQIAARAESRPPLLARPSDVPSRHVGPAAGAAGPAGQRRVGRGGRRGSRGRGRGPAWLRDRRAAPRRRVAERRVGPRPSDAEGRSLVGSGARGDMGGSLARRVRPRAQGGWPWTRLRGPAARCAPDAQASRQYRSNRIGSAADIPDETGAAATCRIACLTRRVSSEGSKREQQKK